VARCSDVFPHPLALPIISSLLTPALLLCLVLFSGPTVVLVSSLLFIGSVVLLHIWGKFSSRA
jgi:hypothetical protein